MGEEELKRLHSQYRLELSEHIEQCHAAACRSIFPGFRYETLVGTRGWGAAISRDDLSLSAGRRENSFSRLEVVVRPFASSHVLELAAKGTIRNKEIFNRNQYQMLSHVDIVLVPRAGRPLDPGIRRALRGQKLTIATSPAGEAPCVTRPRPAREPTS